MKLLLIGLLLAFAFCLCAHGQTVVLTDNFEGGMGLWQSFFWSVSDSFSVSPIHSFTDTDTTQYFSNTTLTAEMTVGANLSGYLGATLQFQALYWIEPNFDFCHVQVSRDGIFWVTVFSLTGVHPEWELVSYDIGAFAGFPNVRVRFAMQADQQTNYDGIYIDDLAILGWPEDTSSPLILHDEPVGYEGSPHTESVNAQIWDATGILSESLLFSVDGSAYQQAPRDSVVGETYYHRIPAQEAGALVQYYFTATDASPLQNSSVSDTFAYLAGTMLIQDDGVSEAVWEPASGELAAVGFRAPPEGYITSAVFSIYTDMFHPLDSVAVYVWADSEGVPGPVLAGPFNIYPASDPIVHEIWTWLDLRPALIPAPDTFHVGLEFGLTGSDLMALSMSSPAVFQQSHVDTGAGFQPYTLGDFMIRCVVGDLSSAVEPGGSAALPQQAAITAYPNPTNGAFRLKIEGVYSGQAREARLYDLAGRQIKKWHIQPPGASPTVSIQLPDGLAGGIYLLEVGFEGGLRPERLKLIYLP